ncbi:MAG: broad specificity phosphatase PhoE, partial [Nonlabens sp.]
MQQEWYFIRHGQTDYNLRGIVQGSGIDSELNENGIR